LIQGALERAHLAGQLHPRKRESPPPTDHELSVCATIIKETEGCLPGGGFDLLRQAALNMLSKARKA
jgi:hypothetical protein